MDPVVALAQLGGVAPIGEWRRMAGRAPARDAITTGAVVVLPRQQVALPSIGVARSAAAAAGGTISHLSAALHYGWKVKAEPPLPTITVPRRRRRPHDLPPMELHWADLLPEATADGVTTPVQTVVDCARAYDVDVALCVADSALRSRMVRPDELLAAASSSARTGRPRAIHVASEASALAANPFESVLRAIALEVTGLAVRPQGWIGNAGRADLVDDRLMIAIEADSWTHHGTRESFRRDVRRYTEFARLGWVVVRFLWEDVMQHPDRVRRHLAQVVEVRSAQLGFDAGSSPRRRAS